MAATPDFQSRLTARLGGVAEGSVAHDAAVDLLAANAIASIVAALPSPADLPVKLSTGAKWAKIVSDARQQLTKLTSDPTVIAEVERRLPAVIAVWRNAWSQ